MRLVYIDTETGGLDAKANGLTEVALVAFDIDPLLPEVCHIVESECIKVAFNPHMSYVPYALHIQNREYYDNANSVSEATTRSRILDFLAKHLGEWQTKDDYRGRIVAQYAEFDYGFIRALFERDTISWKHLFDARCTWLCTRNMMRLLRSIGASTCPKDSLKDILDYYNILRTENEQEHSALADASMGVTAYQRMLQELRSYYGGQHDSCDFA